MAQKWLQRILLVNDDGIDAPGIKLLEDVAQQLADEVWVVAPATDKSGVANSVSLREPVRVEQRGERRYAVHGTPADCVTMAIQNLMKKQLPQLILSGINNGSNIGFETVLSGTVGAAITGLLLGVPSVALSQDKRPEDAVNWRTAETFCLPVLDTLISRGLPTDCCLSINFPDLPADRIKGIPVFKPVVGSHQLNWQQTVTSAATTLVVHAKWSELTITFQQPAAMAWRNAEHLSSLTGT